MIPAWVLSLGVIVVATMSSFGGLYDTAAKRASLAASMVGNTSLRALYGPLYSDSLGGLGAWRTIAFGTALAGLMGALVVVRHTREEEEAGRLELIGAGAVGRRAPLAAALLTAAVAALAATVVVTLCAVLQGVVGALALGLTFGVSALCFAAVAAVAAQLTASARAVRGIAGAVLGAAFLLRATGDGTGPHGTSLPALLSPLGWVERVRPYAAERWWLLAAPVLLGLLLAAAAFALVARRDLDAAVLPGRGPGPAAAGPRLRGAFGLAWRLQRGAVYGWSIGYAVSGVALGALAKGAVQTVRGNRQLVDSFAHLGGSRDLTQSYLATIAATLGMVAAVFTVQAVLRLRGEEQGGRLEPVLAASVGRLRYAGAHLVVAGAGSVALMAVGGVTTGLGYGAAIGDPGGHLGSMLAAGLVQLPAVWLVSAFAVLLHGAAPRYALAGWSVVSLSVGLGLYGPLLGFTPWVLDLSAFAHVPKLPGATPTAAPLLWLAAGAAVLTAGGLAGLRRRDAA